MHYNYFVVLGYDPIRGTATSMWLDFTATMQPFRMPLLVFVSGVLMARTLGSRSPRGILLRAAGSYYLYALWLVLFLAIGLTFEQSVVSKPSTPAVIWGQFLVPTNELWFVYALAVWTLAMGLLSRTPRWVPVVIGSALWLWVDLGGVEFPGMMASVVRYGVFFAIGVALGGWAKEGFERIRVWHGALAVVIAVCLWQVSDLSAFPEAAASVFVLLRSVVGVCAAIAVISGLCRVRWFARCTGFIGRRTLPIYVMHMPIIWSVILISPIRELLLADAFRWGWPLVGTGYIVAVSLAVYWATNRSWGRLLFTTPWAFARARRQEQKTPQSVAAASRP